MSSSRLVGRDDELLALTEWIDQIQMEPRGRVCYLEAEAGMGKSRLLQEVLAFADPGVLCLAGKCESFRSNISYWPLINILESEEFPETASGRRLKSLLALAAPDNADDVLLRSLSPVDLRQELLACVREFLLELAEHRPVLLVVEDIHDLDLSSLDLLDFLLPLTDRARVSIMLVARAEMAGAHRAVISKAERVCQERYLRVSFSSLTDDESYALVRDLLGTRSLPPGLWKLVEGFSGRPLSIEEALRFLVERGWLWRSNGSWQLAALERALDRGVPTDFRELLLGRLDHLNNETLHVFQAAAVLGEFVDRTALAHTVHEPDLASRLAELVERGWLLPEEPHVYRFKHTLTRETVYSTLLTSKRQILHQRAGEAMEALGPEFEEESVELLAHHFAHSSLHERALQYLVRAGAKSAARHALPESLSYYQQAQQLLPRCPHLQAGLGPRIAVGLADVHLAFGEPAAAIGDVSPLLEKTPLQVPPQLRAACHRRAGAARRAMGEFPAALEHYRAALSLLATESAAQVRAVLSGTAGEEACASELGIAQTLFDMRENQKARELAEELLSAIDRRMHPRLAAEAHNLLGGIAHRTGDSETGRRMVQMSLSIHQSSGNRAGAAACYSNLGILAAVNRDPETAGENFELSLALREQLGDSRGIAVTRNNLGQLERDRGRFTEAAQHLQLATETARRSELTQVLAQCLANLGHVMTLTNCSEEALAALDEAESLCQSYGYRDLRCEVLWKRAECLVESGELPAAEAQASSAAVFAVELRSRDLESEARRALARTYRKMGRPDQAREEAGVAWSARAWDSNPVSRARFAAEYSLCLMACNQQRQARELLLEAVEAVDLHESPTFMQDLSEALATVRTE
jgi:tetratricopeptide (TPR) repeat protein